MTTTTISSHDFNQDVNRARRAADNGPVIITNRGEPAYVLLRYDAYRRLASHQPGIRELLSLTGIEEIEFEPARLGETVFSPVALS